MLVTQDEMVYSFGGAKFNLESSADRALLGWIFNQFLYGEVTGIQCGHWLYLAPTLSAATFLARQASEELAHVRKVLRILTILNEKPRKVHWAIRFLTTGMMGSSWGEHVVLEMALGEGLVLGMFYAMRDTIPNPEAVKILSQALVEEERHVEFGENETRSWLQAHAKERKAILGLAMIQLWVLQRLKNFVRKKLPQVIEKIQSESGAVVAKIDLHQHPVLSQFEKFYDHTLFCFELRIERLKLSDIPIRNFSFAYKLSLIGAVVGRFLKEKLRFKPPLLTATYLEDPILLAELKRNPKEVAPSV